MNFSSFDPWTATDETRRQIYNKAMDILTSEEEPAINLPNDLENAFERLCAWGEINDMKEEIETDKNLLSGRCTLVCLKKALEVGISIPDWLFRSFASKVEAVTTNQAKQWSDPIAFGLCRKKGCHRKKEKQTLEIGVSLHQVMAFHGLSGKRDSFVELKRILLSELGLDELIEVLSRDDDKFYSHHIKAIREANKTCSLQYFIPEEQLVAIFSLDESRLEQIFSAYKEIPAEIPNWVLKLTVTR